MSKETLEEVSKLIYPSWYTDYEEGVKRRMWVRGAKWQQERSYSEDEVKSILNELKNTYSKYWKSDAPWSFENKFDVWVTNILKKK